MNSPSFSIIELWENADNTQWPNCPLMERQRQLENIDLGARERETSISANYVIDLMSKHEDWSPRIDLQGGSVTENSWS